MAGPLLLLVEALDEAPHFVCSVQITDHHQLHTQTDGGMVLGLWMFSKIARHRGIGIRQVASVNVLKGALLAPIHVLCSGHFYLRASTSVFRTGIGGAFCALNILLVARRAGARQTKPRPVLATSARLVLAGHLTPDFGSRFHGGLL
jgi:hypothetical protein